MRGRYNVEKVRSCVLRAGSSYRQCRTPKAGPTQVAPRSPPMFAQRECFDPHRRRRPCASMRMTNGPLIFFREARRLSFEATEFRSHYRSVITLTIGEGSAL